MENSVRWPGYNTAAQCCNPVKTQLRIAVQTGLKCVLNMSQKHVTALDFPRLTQPVPIYTAIPNYFIAMLGEYHVVTGSPWQYTCNFLVGGPSDLHRREDFLHPFLAIKLKGVTSAPPKFSWGSTFFLVISERQEQISSLPFGKS